MRSYHSYKDSKRKFEWYHVVAFCFVYFVFSLILIEAISGR